MTCKEFEKSIPAFLEGKLEHASLKQFMKHMEECGDCHEELVIQFLVTEGMQHLEEGDVFDLQNELNLRLEEARKRIKFRSLLLYIGAGLETLVALMIVGILLWLIL